MPCCGRPAALRWSDLHRTACTESPPPRPQLDLADHPRLADLDGWLDGEDAPRTIPPPPVLRDRAARVRLGAPGPGVVNPPSAKIRRQGLGAQFTGDLRTDRRRHQLDPLHELLGDYLDDEPELENATPAVTAESGAVVKIDRLAMMHLMITRCTSLG